MKIIRTTANSNFNPIEFDTFNFTGDVQSASVLWHKILRRECGKINFRIEHTIHQSFIFDIHGSVYLTIIMLRVEITFCIILFVSLGLKFCSFNFFSSRIKINLFP